MESITFNLAAKARAETVNGREYLVAPATMIVPGVLKGSEGSLYYPAEEVAANPHDWNGIPLVVHHPFVDGKPVSARHPDVWANSEVGRVFNAHTCPEGKLKSEAWFDVKDTQRVRPDIIDNLRAGKPIELSTGLFTRNVKAPPGSHHNGTHYDYVARQYKPDHLAVLPDQRGACNTDHGCGILVNKEPTMPDATLTNNAAGKGEACKAMGPVADKFSEVAAEHTEKANGTNDKNESSVAHKNAADAHQDAAAAHRLASNKPKADMHRQMSDFHRSQSYGGGDYPMSRNSEGEPMDRNAKILYLTTNCDCWKDEEGKKVLNGFTDGKVAQLFDQYAKPPAPAATAPTPAPANNYSSDEAWLASAPPGVKAAVYEAMQVVNQAKSRIVDKLVANVAHDKRQKHIDVLMLKTKDELEMELERLPVQSGMTNNGYVPPTLAPRYIGAGATPGQATGQQVNNTQEDDEILHLPVINWNEPVNPVQTSAS